MPRTNAPRTPRSPRPPRSLHRLRARPARTTWAVPLAGLLMARGAAHAEGRPKPDPEAERVRQLASAACLATARPTDDPDEAARARRIRLAPALPSLSFRAHVGDGGYRRLDLENVSTGETLTATRGLELRLSWSLDELAYRPDELAQLRLGLERRAQGERLRHQCADLAARWVRARVDPTRDDAEERAAYTALDVATGGELARLERSAPR